MFAIDQFMFSVQHHNNGCPTWEEYAIAWDHINLLGYYQFYRRLALDLAKIIKSWRWQEQVNFG